MIRLPCWLDSLRATDLLKNLSWSIESHLMQITIPNRPMDSNYIIIIVANIASCGGPFNWGNGCSKLFAYL